MTRVPFFARLFGRVLDSETGAYIEFGSKRWIIRNGVCVGWYHQEGTL